LTEKGRRGQPPVAPAAGQRSDDEAPAGPSAPNRSEELRRIKDSFLDDG
jgi:hypothetical protein